MTTARQRYSDRRDPRAGPLVAPPQRNIETDLFGCAVFWLTNDNTDAGTGAVLIVDAGVQ